MALKSCSNDVFLLPANEVMGKVIFLHLSVSHSVHRGGIPGQVPPSGPGTPPRTRYTSMGPGTPPNTRYTPRDQVHPQDQLHHPGPGTPPRARYTPWDQVHPHEQYMLGNRGNKQAVGILLECILVLELQSQSIKWVFNIFKCCTLHTEMHQS